MSSFPAHFCIDHNSLNSGPQKTAHVLPQKLQLSMVSSFQQSNYAYCPLKLNVLPVLDLIKE